MSNPLHWWIVGRFWPVFTGNELAAKQFADRRFWNLGDEFVASRALEIREARAFAERVQLAGFDRGSTLDEGADNFAPAFVRQSGNRHFRDCRMQRQATFDLNRR